MTVVYDAEKTRFVDRVAAKVASMMEREVDKIAMEQAEQRAGAAAYWLLVETGVVSKRPAPVFWDMPAEERAPYVRLAHAIVAREKNAYNAGQMLFDDAIRDRDAAEERLEEARVAMLKLQEKVEGLEAKLGIRQADAAFEAVDETLKE